MSDSCLFCGVVEGTVGSQTVLETPTTVAFRDIRPVTPVHVLVVPRVHVDDLRRLGPEHRDLAADLLATVAAVAEAEGIAEGGYRVVVNVGEDGGQVVGHLHFHVIGGRPLRGLVPGPASA